MVLGLGHSLTGGSNARPHGVRNFNDYALDFDGVNDYALAGISGQDPANGTIKPITPTNGLTVAAWVKLDIDSDSYNDGGDYQILGANVNGGYYLQYSGKKFIFHVKLVDGAGNAVITKPISTFAAMKTPASGTDYARFLNKSDNWHFVVGTWDGVNTKQIYVDGDRSQAGAADGDGTTGTKYGSQPETSDSKKVETGPTDGAYQISWDSDYDRDEADFIVGAQPSWTQATNVTAGSANFWPGQIGDVAVWDKELTQAEIKALYNLHVPIDMSTTQAGNLQGYWKSEWPGTGTIVKEETGNVGSDLTLYNGVDNSSTEVPTLDVVELDSGGTWNPYS